MKKDEDIGHVLRSKNKTGDTATQVRCGLTGTVIEKSKLLGRDSNSKNAHKGREKQSVADQSTDRATQLVKESSARD